MICGICKKDVPRFLRKKTINSKPYFVDNTYSPWGTDRCPKCFKREKEIMGYIPAGSFEEEMYNTEVEVPHERERSKKKCIRCSRKLRMGYYFHCITCFKSTRLEYGYAAEDFSGGVREGLL